jgi:hypothetical protein
LRAAGNFDAVLAGTQWFVMAGGAGWHRPLTRQWFPVDGLRLEASGGLVGPGDLLEEGC